MRRIGTLVLCGCAAAFAATSATAGAPPGSWYLAPEVMALWLDDGRAADDDAGLALAVGRTLNADWDLEASVFGSHHKRAGNGTLDLSGFALSTKWVFYREGRVNPFLSFGLGRVSNRVDPGANDHEYSALYGVGLLIDLGATRTDGSAMQLRADLGARRGLSDATAVKNPVDYVAGIGLQYAWGGEAVHQSSDSDGDGIIDELDKCPNTPAGTPVDTNGCPLPQDDDGDGVINENDKCPGTPAGKAVDAVGCEIDGDDDGDGVPNSQDHCPNTPKGDRVDGSGCSITAEIKLPGVVFANNKADLLPESMPALETAIATLKRNPTLSVEVDGHTDNRGSDAYNQDLSARRAATVLKYLRDAGVTNPMTSRGYGESDPIASNDTEGGRQENRRVVLRVLN